MKVAVSFSGQPRIINNALKSWKRLIQTYNADVFIHAWNDNNYSAQSLCEMFSPKLSIIDEPKQFNVDLYTERLIYSNPQNVLSMWTSILSSFNLTRSYNDYDIIIRGRFDVGFDPFELTLSDGITIPGKPSETYNYFGKIYNGWHDMIAYGDPISMSKYCHTLNVIPILYSQGGPFFSEFFLSTNLFISNINVIHQNVWADIIKN